MTTTTATSTRIRRRRRQHPRSSALSLSLPLLFLLLLPLASAGFFSSNNNNAAPGSYTLNLIDDDPTDTHTHARDSEGVTTGTTMIAAKYKDGVVIGADSRSVKNGRYISDRFTDKILQVSDHVVLACSGRTSIIQRLTQELTTRLRFFSLKHDRPATPRTAAALMRILLRRGLSPAMDEEEGQDKNNQIGMDTDALAAGWSPTEGPRIYQILAGGTVLEARNYAVSGKGSMYVVGLLDLHYHPKDGHTHTHTHTPLHDDTKEGKGATPSSSSTLTPPSPRPYTHTHTHTHITKEECQNLVTQALALAVGRDTHTGGCVCVCVVDSKGVEKHTLTPAEVQKAMKAGMGSLKKKEQEEEKEKEKERS